jgi:hypothetical protein
MLRERSTAEPIPLQCCLFRSGTIMFACYGCGGAWPEDSRASEKNVPYFRANCPMSYFIGECFILATCHRQLVAREPNLQVTRPAPMRVPNASCRNHDIYLCKACFGAFPWPPLRGSYRPSLLVTLVQNRIRLIVTDSNYNTIQIWDASMGEKYPTLAGWRTYRVRLSCFEIRIWNGDTSQTVVFLSQLNAISVNCGIPSSMQDTSSLTLGTRASAYWPVR